MSEETTKSGGVEALRQNCTEQLEVCVETIRNSPAQAVLIAAGGGFLLSKLPIFRLLAITLRLAFMALPPTLFVMGIVKAVELVRSK